MIADLPSLISQCAANVGPTTMMAIVRTESGGNPFSINDNTIRLSRQPTSYPAAIGLATQLIQKGHNIDMGLAQINSKNLSWLGLSVSQIFEPCANLRAGAKILSNGYERAARRYGPGQQALLAAFSTYNTGSLVRGFANGYVQKVVANSGKSITYSVPQMPVGLILEGHAGRVVVTDPRKSPLSVWETSTPQTRVDSKEEPLLQVKYSPRNSPLQAQGF